MRSSTLGSATDKRSSSAPPGFDLQRDGTSLQYQRRLELAGCRLLEWCDLQRCDIKKAAGTADEMGKLLILYLQHLYDSRHAFWWAPHSVLYVQTRWRSLKGHLRAAWDSVSTWKMTQPIRSRVPFRLELVQAACYAATLHTTSLDVKRAPMWWALVVVLHLAFFGLLRPKETCQLQVGHVMAPGPGTFRAMSCAVLTVL
jgi:hypothetical protein